MFRLLVIFLAVLAFANASSTLAPSTSPSVAPSKSPTVAPSKSPTVTPSKNPTFVVGTPEAPNKEKLVCPTQTFGKDTGNIVISGAFTDGSDFVGQPVGANFAAGRSASTVLVYQSNSTQKIIARFATQYANKALLSSDSPPNITWSDVQYGFTNSTGVVSLRTAIYAPKEVTAAYLVDGRLRLKWLKTSNFRFGSEIDTGLVTADQDVHIRVAAAYYVIAIGQTATSPKIQRMMTSTLDGAQSFTFAPVDSSIDLPPASRIPGSSSASPATSAVDARGFIVIAYITTGPQIAIASYNSSRYTNKIEGRLLIPVGTTPNRISIASPTFNFFLMVYSDSSNRIYAVFTKDAFATATAATQIALITAFTPGSLSLTWSSNNTINVWMGEANQKFWALPYVWDYTKIRANETHPNRFDNQTLGAWSPSPVLMYESPVAWTAASVSGQTNYGYNIFHDTVPVSGLKSIRSSNCLVYTFVNTTRSAGNMVVASAISAFILLFSMFVTL